VRRLQRRPRPSVCSWPEDFGHRGHCGGVATPASYLGHEQPGSAVEAEAGAGCRPRTVTGGAVRRSPWTDMGAVRALEEGEASEHHNKPRRRARLRLLVRLGGPGVDRERSGG
jgi:hypothetical protein